MEYDEIIYSTDTDDQTRELEAALISDWQPLCNILLR